jgi:hypothetical protein
LYIYNTYIYHDFSINPSIPTFIIGPQIVSCVAKNFDPSDFEILFASPRESSRSDIFHRITFYQKLASSRFGLGLPGLGYDCFRTWEYLMMGTIPVIERGVGLDRMVMILYRYTD